MDSKSIWGILIMVVVVIGALYIYDKVVKKT